MNILMINPVHPQTAHISAVRAWQFAQGLAGLGHRVVLLTGTSPTGGQQAGNDLAAHDWSKPRVLAVDAGKQGKTRLPFPLNKVRTVWRMVIGGGAQGRWVHNGVQTVRENASQFRPDVVWCTFGMMEAVFAARRAAKAFGCPWVLDIKDNWELYVPPGLRRLMVRRTRGWAAVTANAEFTARKARIWQCSDAEAIYSGVDDVFFASLVRRGTVEECAITFVGSLYFPEHLAVLLEGIGRWHANLTEGEKGKVVVRYLGGDVAMFATAVRECIPHVRTEARGYVPTEELAACCRGSKVNMYVAHQGGFHHKLLELLACGRPMLVYPGESEESRRLVLEGGGELLEPVSAVQVAEMLAEVFFRESQTSHAPAAETSLRRYAWENQSKALEKVLLKVVKDNER